MQRVPVLLFCIFLGTALYGQKIPRPARTMQFSIISPVTLYENTGYTGSSKGLAAGQHLLSDFNDKASSIKVAPGFVAVIYEHADAKGGYGISVDLLEDQPDLSAFNFDDKVSYINIFPATKNNIYEWKRNSLVNGQFVTGRWARKRAKPQPDDFSHIPVVSPSRPPNVTGTTALQVNGPTTTITSLGSLDPDAATLWERANKHQLGVIGNDFRGKEELGSACFERASHNALIPDNINFWYLQQQKNDHRDIVFFKRTLAGKVREARQANISGTYQDYDVNIDIVPNENYIYLIHDAKEREYTTIMSAQYNGTRILPYIQDQGQHDCDDPESRAQFTAVEAEIAPEYWPQGNHKFGRSSFTDMCLIRTGKDICVYGPWIYDKGHCCHPEIHPAEQVWWSEPQGNRVKYNLNVFCDASKRFWWRKQMDDGTKLRPWAAPPIKGLFALAFEVQLGQNNAIISQVTQKFEVSNVEHYNVIEYPNADQVYNLVYQGKTLVSFIPHNNAFKVSFEHVGLKPGTNTVRGFLVIETSVGVVTQIATSILVPEGTGFRRVTIPANSDPDKVDQRYEDRFFKKEDGRYMFSILQTQVTTKPVFEAGRLIN